MGQLVERLDATDLNTALANRITCPLGLSETRFASPGNSVVEGLAGGWSPGVVDGDPAAAYDSIASSAWAAGALISTTGDLATFLAALFAGDLISAEALTEMTTTGVEGYGLGLHAGPSDGPFHSGFGHTGGIDGYSSIMLIDPVTGDTVVVLTNNDALNAQDLAVTIIGGW